MAKNHLPLLYYETMKTMKLASSTGYAVLVPLGAALFMARVVFFKKASRVISCKGERDTKDGI